MSMSQGKAETWVIASAATVGGVYAYTKWKGSNKTPVTEFVTAWGVVYVVLSIGATAMPGVAGAMAIVVMVSDLLGNMPSLVEAIKSSGVPVSGQTASKPTTQQKGSS